MSGNDNRVQIETFIEHLLITGSNNEVFGNGAEAYVGKIKVQGRSTYLHSICMGGLSMSGNHGGTRLGSMSVGARPGKEKKERDDQPQD